MYALSVNRPKEVGTGKVGVALLKQLDRRFMGELVLLCMIAFLFTIGLAMLCLGGFNHLAGKTISQGVFHEGSTLFLLFLAAVRIGLLAGGWPAPVVLSFPPPVVLEGRCAMCCRGYLCRQRLGISQ